ncbi:MAG: phosphate/phosphite/phosphonate ABC transporter substrate-binding protein [Bdellovibrionaceae bacterium]|nr:phosphate/phosphite/phosphonate ABC transporter substrate-binding protein [Pseudobdellovibrionaceae bacterium]
MKNSLISLLLTLSCAGAVAAENAIVVALKPDKNPEAMLQERKELESFLSKETGRPVKVVIPLSGSVIQEGFINGTVDLAYISGLEMVRAAKAKAAELLLVTEIEGKTSYESYWVSLKDKPYNKVQDLKGKPVAFASRTSTSGYLVPMADLVQKKLLKEKAAPEEYFGKGHVTYGTGYVSAIERVLQGQSEAAAVSDYVIKGDKHLTAEQKARLKVVTQQGPVPTHILAVRTNLEAKTREALQKALLKLNEKPELRDRLFTAKLVTTTYDKQVASLAKAMEQTGLTLE